METRYEIAANMKLHNGKIEIICFVVLLYLKQQLL